MRITGRGNARDMLIEDAYDAWLISKILHPGDLVRARTHRKVLRGKENVRIPVTLTLHVTESRFEQERLLIRGMTLTEHEDIPKGSMHTLRLAGGDWLHIEKEDWDQAEELLRRGSAARKRILLALFDDRRLTLATFQYGRLVILSTESLDVQGKQHAVSMPITLIVKQRVEEKAREYDLIIIGGPAFWLEGLPGSWKRIAISSSQPSSWREFLQREDVREALRGIDAAEEALLAEDTRRSLAKDMLAYPLREVREALSIGAVAHLITTEKALTKTPPEVQEELFSMARATRCKITILQADKDFIHFTEKLGGWLGILRYPLHPSLPPTTGGKAT